MRFGLCEGIVFYISLLGVILGREKLDRIAKIVLWAMFLLGASKVVWYLVVHYFQGYTNNYDSYDAAGKRVLAACVIGYYLFSNISFINKDFLKKTIAATMVSAFVVAGVVGGWQYIHGASRVDFLVGRATDGAYMYAALSAFLIFMLPESKHRFEVTVSLFAITYVLILFTGTRSMVFAYPVIMLVCAVASYKLTLVKKVFLYY